MKASSMAEVLGIVAGGVSLASLTIQLVEQANKLSKFLNAIKDFPEEIREMVEELDVLASTLDQHANGRMSGLQTRAEKRCKELSTLLHEVLGELEEAQKKAKYRHTWASIKAAMKRERIDCMIQKVRRVHNLLALMSQAVFKYIYSFVCVNDSAR